SCYRYTNPQCNHIVIAAPSTVKPRPSRAFGWGLRWVQEACSTAGGTSPAALATLAALFLFATRSGSTRAGVLAVPATPAAAPRALVRPGLARKSARLAVLLRLGRLVGLEVAQNLLDRQEAVAVGVHRQKLVERLAGLLPLVQTHLTVLVAGVVQLGEP